MLTQGDKWSDYNTWKNALANVVLQNKAYLCNWVYTEPWSDFAYSWNIDDQITDELDRAPVSKMAIANAKRGAPETHYAILPPKHPLYTTKIDVINKTLTQKHNGRTVAVPTTFV